MYWWMLVITDRTDPFQMALREENNKIWDIKDKLLKKSNLVDLRQFLECVWSADGCY